MVGVYENGFKISQSEISADLFTINTIMVQECTSW
jgi:hypothetical protein